MDVLLQYLTYWHGRSGEPHQHDYYRCHGCKTIVTWHAIRKGGCPCGLSRNISPAVLSWFEKARLLLFPWIGVRR